MNAEKRGSDHETIPKNFLRFVTSAFIRSKILRINQPPDRRDQIFRFDRLRDMQLVTG